MILFSSSVVHVTVMIRLELQNILLTNGLRSEIFKQVVDLIELLQIETEVFVVGGEGRLWVAITNNKQLNKQFAWRYEQINYRFSATEIWAEDVAAETVNIKQVQPILSNYYFYPELFTVASDFCTRNWSYKHIQKMKQ